MLLALAKTGSGHKILKNFRAEYLLFRENMHSDRLKHMT